MSGRRFRWRMLFCGRDEKRGVSEWKKGGEGKDVPTCVALHVPRIRLDGGLFPSFDDLGVEIRRADRRKRRNSSLHLSSAHYSTKKGIEHTFMLYRCQSDAKCCLCRAGSLNATAHEMHVNTWEASKSAMLRC